jgi:uncharacterized protein
MAIILPLALVLALTLTANRVAESGNPRSHKAFTALLLIINVFLATLGLILFFLPENPVFLLQDSPTETINVQAMALIMFATGVWGITVCWLPFRRFLARFMALDVNSPVHLTALLLAGYLVGNTALALSQEFLQQLNTTDLAVSILDVVLQQAGFALLALTGAGLFVRRDLGQVYNRLGLVRPSLRQLVIGSAVVILLLLIQGTIGGIWALLDPEQAEQLGNLNEALLAGFDSVGEWLILALASGIGEEMLFRGALQPVFGLPITSLLFAIVHIQYGLTPITFVVFFLGLILGLVRRYSNTTVAIYVHFSYNFLLGLFSMLALHLEQFVTP